MNGAKLWRFYENCKAAGYRFAVDGAGVVTVTEPAHFQNPVMRQEIAQRARWLPDLVRLDGYLGRGLLAKEVAHVRDLAARLYLDVEFEPLDLETGARHVWTAAGAVEPEDAGEFDPVHAWMKPRKAVKVG